MACGPAAGVGALREVRGQGQGTYFAFCPGTFWRPAELPKSVSDRFGKGTGKHQSQVVPKLHASLEGIGHMLQGLLEKRATNRAYHREYQRTVDDCLTVLFRGFPEGSLPSLRQRVGSSGLVRRGEAEGTDVRACSVQVAVLLIRKLIGPLSNRNAKNSSRPSWRMTPATRLTGASSTCFGSWSSSKSRPLSLRT